MTIVHINQNIIRSNKKHDRDDPPILIRWKAKEVGHARAVNIQGPCRIVYSPDKPLPCGAKVWIETDAEIAYQP